MQMTLALMLQQAPLTRDGLSIAADVAVVVTGAAIIVLAVIAGVVLLGLRRAVNETRIGVRQNMGPVSDRARAISDNVEFITQALRTDVERLNASVKSLTDRLQLASERMEERIEEFNALMEVVQSEAEDIFLDTASTVRGVRAGARSIRSGREQGPTQAGGPARESDTPSDEDRGDATQEPSAVVGEDA